MPPTSRPVPLAPPADAGSGVSKLGIWLGVLALGVLLIVSFEVGYRLGLKPTRKEREESRTEVAKVTPPVATATTPSRPAVPTAKAPEPPRPTPPSAKPPAPVTPTAKAKPPAPKPPPEPKPEPPPMATPTFAADILPVFKDKCINCHGGLSKRGGLDMRTVADLLKGGNSGPSLVKGKPGDSPLWNSIDQGQMPPEGKPPLTPREKQLIRAWIAGGAK